MGKKLADEGDEVRSKVIWPDIYIYIYVVYTVYIYISHINI